VRLRAFFALITRLAFPIVMAVPSALAGPPLGDAQLLRILPLASTVRGGFDGLEEVPVDPSGDATLRDWGVRAQRARHYTRDGRAGIQVCSVEAWEFESEPQARAALAGFQYPDWEILQRGSVMLMARGLTQPRDAPGQRGVFPECRAILERAADRAPRAPRS
jgi:hypothetical protein